MHDDQEPPYNLKLRQFTLPPVHGGWELGDLKIQQIKGGKWEAQAGKQGEHLFIGETFRGMFCYLESSNADMFFENLEEPKSEAQKSAEFAARLLDHKYPPLGTPRPYVELRLHGMHNPPSKLPWKDGAYLHPLASVSPPIEGCKESQGWTALVCLGESARGFGAPTLTDLIRQVENYCDVKHTAKVQVTFAGEPVDVGDPVLGTFTKGSPDTINHPAHYTQGKHESIDIIEDQGHLRGFCYGNVLKYMHRAPHKGKELKDLKKARWYLNKLIGAEEESDAP